MILVAIRGRNGVLGVVDEMTATVFTPKVKTDQETVIYQWTLRRNGPISNIARAASNKNTHDN